LPPVLFPDPCRPWPACLPTGLHGLHVASKRPRPSIATATSPRRTVGRVCANEKTNRRRSWRTWNGSVEAILDHGFKPNCHVCSLLVIARTLTGTIPHMRQWNTTASLTLDAGTIQSPHSMRSLYTLSHALRATPQFNEWHGGSGSPQSPFVHAL
jgi:hypothetical protein